MTDKGGIAHGSIRQLLGCQCQKEIEALRFRLQQAEQERDRLKPIVEAKVLSLNKGDEEQRWMMQEENIELREANTAMREDIQRLYDDYDRRIQSAAEMLQNPSASVDQQKRVSIKRGEYRSFLAELYSILSRYPKEGGELNESNRGN